MLNMLDKGDKRPSKSWVEGEQGFTMPGKLLHVLSESLCISGTRWGDRETGLRKLPTRLLGGTGGLPTYPWKHLQ